MSEHIKLSINRSTSNNDFKNKLSSGLAFFIITWAMFVTNTRAQWPLLFNFTLSPLILFSEVINNVECGIARPDPIGLCITGYSTVSATQLSTNIKRLEISIRNHTKHHYNTLKHLKTHMSKVIVAGSINNDIVVLASRHPKTGESLIGENVQYFPGGKGANQAIAAAKLGATTTLLGKVGNDSTGEQLTAFIASQGVTTNISLSNVATGTALITVSAQTTDNTIIVVPGANMKLSEHDITEVKIAKEDILVSQFEIPDDTFKYFFKKGKQIGAVTLLNPSPSKNISNELLSLVDIIIINETELEMLSGLKILTDDDPSILNATKKITKVGQSIVVTLGAKGVLAVITYIPRLKKSDWYFQKKQTGSKSILKSRQLSNRKIAIKKYN